MDGMGEGDKVPILDMISSSSEVYSFPMVQSILL